MHKWHRLKQFKVLDSPDSVFQNAYENWKRTKMKILQFLTIFTLENIKTSANQIEDITLERLLTYFKYEVCLAKVRFWRGFYKGLQAWKLQVETIYDHITCRVSIKRFAIMLTHFWNQTAWKELIPVHALPFDNSMAMMNRPTHAKNFILVDVEVTEIRNG